MRISGIDIGFGFTKATDGKEFIVFKSIVGEASDMLFRLDLLENDLTGGFHITLDGQNYFVGDLAEQQSNVRLFTLDQEKFVSDFTKLFALTALGHLADDYAMINVVSGLPVGFYKDYHQRLAQILTDSHEITFQGPDESAQLKRIKIGEIRIIPQPLGSVLNLLMDEKGKITNMDLAKQKVGVVDIGFRTTDLCIFDRLQYVERGSTTTDTGMAKGFSIIARKLKEECGVNVELYRMYNAMEAGSIKIRGKDINISKLRDKVYANTARTIAADMDRLWSDDWDMDAIVITGGGSRELAEILQPQVTGNVIPVPYKIDTRLNNVKGYLKYGCHLWQTVEPKTIDSNSE
jgi:plasmid segregation protein ParM